MRIVTWNLEGRWRARHRELLESLDADVLLLTEVSAALEMPGYAVEASPSVMAATRRWSAVLTRSTSVPLPAPHPASAAVAVGGFSICSSVLPWLGWQPVEGREAPWAGDQTQRMHATCRAIGQALAASPSVVWGGDWNTPLEGSLVGFNRRAQRSVLDTLERLGLSVPTAGLPSAKTGCQSIDHIALPDRWTVASAEAVPVDRQLSDHWAYVVDARTSADRQATASADLTAGQQ